MQSWHELKIEGDGPYEEEQESQEAIIGLLRDTYEAAYHAIDYRGDGFNWYNWTNALRDLAAFSAKVPGVRFILNIEYKFGEYQRIYAREGKSYKVDGEVTYPEFDEEKLQ
jgi:hypothetical protein